MFFACALAGCDSSFLHQHSEEAEHGFAGTKRLVNPNLARGKGQCPTYSRHNKLLA